MIIIIIITIKSSNSAALPLEDAHPGSQFWL